MRRDVATAVRARRATAREPHARLCGRARRVGGHAFAAGCADRQRAGARGAECGARAAYVGLIGTVEKLEGELRGLLSAEDAQEVLARDGTRLVGLARLGGAHGARQLHGGYLLDGRRRVRRLHGRGRVGGRRRHARREQIEQEREKSLRRVLDEVKSDLESHQQVVARALEQPVEDVDDCGGVVKVREAAREANVIGHLHRPIDAH